MSASPPDLSESLATHREAAVLSIRGGVVRGDADAEDLAPEALLHDVQELTDPQVAEIYGVALARAKSRLHRARNRRRAALAEGRTFCGDEQGIQPGASRSRRDPQGTD